MIRETVLFDMGYTLLAPHPSFEDLVVSTLANHGLSTTSQAIRAAEGVAWQRANERLTDRRFTLDPDLSNDFWCGFYDILLQHAGVLATPDPSLNRSLVDVFTTHRSYAFYDDVLPVLERLRARGTRLGVISNWEGWLHDLLVDRGMVDSFECIIVSGAVGLEKPDPAIFELAFAEMGVTAAQCTYVGDSIEYDVTPSIALGVDPILIDRRGRFDGVTLPCRRITSLHALLETSEPCSEPITPPCSVL